MNDRTEIGKITLFRRILHLAETTAVGVLCIIFLSGCMAHKNKITISLNFPRHPGDSIFISRLSAGGTALIAALVPDEQGHARVTLEAIAPAFYMVSNAVDKCVTLVIHPGETVTLNGSLSSPATLVVEGSTDSRLLVDLNNHLAANVARLDSLARMYRDSTTEGNNLPLLASLDSAALTIVSDQQDYNRKFIKDYPSSLVSIMALYQPLTANKPVLDIFTDYSSFARVDSFLYPLFQSLEPVQLLHAEVVKAKEYFSQKITNDKHE